MFKEPTNDRYVYILSDGLLREKVNEGDDGAVLRKWETKDGKKGEKWERSYKEMTGRITGVKFDDGEYGEQIQLTMEDAENKVVLTLPVASNFAEDLMKKLPAIDFAETLTISPYSFTADNGKDKRGVNIYQKSDKVTNFFWDGTKVINGFPVPQGDTSTYSKDQWRLHFLQVRMFLAGYIKENVIPKFTGVSEKKSDYPENDLGPVGF